MRSALSNFTQPSSSHLSLDEEREVLRRETERQALAQLEKARVRTFFFFFFLHSMLCVSCRRMDAIIISHSHLASSPSPAADVFRRSLSHLPFEQTSPTMAL